jgi:hypothetical protein
MFPLAINSNNDNAPVVEANAIKSDSVEKEKPEPKEEEVKQFLTIESNKESEDVITKIHSTNLMFGVVNPNFKDMVIAYAILIIQMVSAIQLSQDAQEKWFNTSCFFTETGLFVAIVNPLVSSYLALKLTELLSPSTMELVTDNLFFKDKNIVLRVLSVFLSFVITPLFTIKRVLTDQNRILTLSRLFVMIIDFVIIGNLISAAVYSTLVQDNFLDILVNFAGILIIVDIDEYFASYLKIKVNVKTIKVEGSTRKRDTSLIKKTANGTLLFCTWVYMESLYEVNSAVTAFCFGYPELEDDGSGGGPVP